MKRKLTHSLHEVQKVHTQTFTKYLQQTIGIMVHTLLKDISHHATEREAIEQKLINKHKNENK